jgi:hypothetical protein
MPKLKGVLAVALIAAGCSSPPASNAGNAPAGSPPAASSTGAPPAEPNAAPSSNAAASPQAEKAPEAASSSPRAAATPSAAAPRWREVTIPAGTTISVKLATPVASDTSKVEDLVRGTLAKSISVDGATVVPAGANVTGSVLEATRSGRVKGKASVAFRFDRLVLDDERHDIQTARIARVAASSTKSDVKKGAIGGAVGGVVGGLIGGAKGAVIGAGAGGAGAVMATRGNEVRLPAGTIVTTTLQKALSVRVPAGDR